MTLPDGGRLWRLRLHAPGATSLALTFDQYNLPEGATLFMYTTDRSVVRGAFTHENNKVWGGLATAPIAGSALVVEYHEPTDVVGRGELSIETLWYGFRSPTEHGRVGDEVARTTYDPVEDFGGSSSCNVNVECHASHADVGNGRRSTVLLIFEGVDQLGSRFRETCSGAVVNSTSNTPTALEPYVLSAAHCFGSRKDLDGDPLTPEYRDRVETNFNTVVATFNYESASCANPSSIPDYSQSISGASLVTYHGRVDILLMELSSPIDPDYFAWYAGWDRTTTAPASAYGLHHPAGDIKKVSIDGDNPTMHAESGAGLASSNIAVDFDTGVIQGGSSGSPLFDPAGRVRGALSGGIFYQCGGGSVATDVLYGSLHAFWTGTYSSPEHQAQSGLSAFLAPGNAGTITLDGTNQAITAPENLVVTNYPYQGPGGPVVPPELDWDDHADPRFGSYTVYRKDPWSSPGFNAIASGLTASQYTDYGMTLDPRYGTQQVKYYVRAVAADASPTSVPSNTVVIEAEPSHFRRGSPEERAPEAFSVRLQSPVQGAAQITVALPEEARVRAEVYDVLGRRVAVLADQPMGPGEHRLSWEGGRQAGGAYLVRVTTGPTGAVGAASAEQRATVRLTLLD